MEPYERRFVRPSLVQLVEALEEARQRVGGESIIDVPPDGWGEVIASIRDCPEGLQQWQEKKPARGASVRLVWWTDAAGRRHFLVRSCGGPDPDFDRHLKRDPGARPPVWHLFPEAVFSPGIPDPMKTR